MWDIKWDFTENDLLKSKSTTQQVYFSELKLNLKRANFVVNGGIA